MNFLRIVFFDRLIRGDPVRHKVKISQIVFVKPQDTVDATAYDTGSIRLDVYAEDAQKELRYLHLQLRPV